MHLGRAATGAVIIATGVGNTGFFGLPLIAASQGEFSLTTAVMYDALGTGILIWTFNPIVASWFGRGEVEDALEMREGLKGLLLPPMWMLVTGLVLGSFVVKQVSHGNYPLALAQSLMVMALVLMIMSWLWNPHSGFMGLGHMMSRYLMSLGLPFERWVKSLADLAERERDPVRFLTQAVQELCALPWVSGVNWRVSSGSGELGRPSRFQAEYSFQEIGRASCRERV